MPENETRVPNGVTFLDRIVERSEHIGAMRERMRVINAYQRLSHEEFQRWLYTADNPLSPL